MDKINILKGQHQTQYKQIPSSERLEISGYSAAPGARVKSSGSSHILTDSTARKSPVRRVASGKKGGRRAFRIPRPVPRREVSNLAASSDSAGENMRCEFFAQSFQSHLEEYGHDYTGLFIAIYPGSFLFNGQMVLREPGHRFDGRAIGKDTHFATLVVDDETGEGVVYDNHHPRGVELTKFLQLIDFSAEFPGERSPKNPFNTPEVGHKELMSAGAVRIYETPARGKLGVGHWKTKVRGNEPMASLQKFADIMPGRIRAHVKTDRERK